MKFLKEEHNAYQYNGHTIIQTSSGYRIKDGKDNWIGGEFDTDADAKEYIKSLNESFDEDSEFRYVASKSVQDSDGFYTDYTWYKTSDGLNVFVFGDNEIYTPEGGYYDHEEEDDDAAQEWFDSYNGFEDDILDENADVHLKLSGDMIEIPIEDNSEVGELGHPIQQGIGDPRAKREKELQEATAVMDRPLSTFSGTLSSVLLAHKDEVDTLFDKQSAIAFLDRILPEVKNKGYVEKVKQEIMRGKSNPVEYFYNIILKGDGDGTEKGGVVTSRSKVRRWAREDLSESLWEKGDYVTLWWRDPAWSKTAPCYASCVFASKTRNGQYKFVSETYGWPYLLDVEKQTVTTPSGKTFNVDNSSGWLKSDISEGWIAKYVPERGDKVQIIGGVYTDSRMDWQTDTDEFIGETGTIVYAGSRYSTFDSVEIDLDNGTKVWTAHGYKPLERNPLKESMDDPKQWPDNKELTYDDALRLSMAYYSQGGDGFYETTERYQFDDEVKMFGPKTVGQMKRDFGVFDSVAKDRMTEAYNIQFYQVFKCPEKPTDNGKMVAQASSEAEAHQKGKELCGEKNYLIKAVCDDGKVRDVDLHDYFNESTSIKEDTFGYKSGNRYYGGLPSEPSDTEYAELISWAASEEDKLLAKYGVKKEHKSTSYDSSQDIYTGSINGHDFEFVQGSSFPSKHWVSKLVIDNKEVDIYKSKRDPNYWATIAKSFNINNLIDMLSSDRLDTIVFKQSSSEVKKTSPLYSFTRSLTYSGYFTPNDILKKLKRIRNIDSYKYPNVEIETRLLSGGSYPCIEEKYIGPKDELVAFMRAVGLNSNFDKDIKLEHPIDESRSINEGMNTYNVTFYMDSLDDNVMSGPTTTKKIQAASEEEASKKLFDSSTDKYYIPTVVKIEKIEEAYVENPRELMRNKREDGAEFDEETGKWIKIDYTDDGEPIEVDADLK